MSNLKNIGIFLGGAVIGGAVTGYVIKSRYEQILKEEIQSVKDVYKNRTGIDEDFITRKEYREEDLMENCEIEQVASTDDIKAYNEQKKDNTKHDYRKYHKKTVVTEEFTEFDSELNNVQVFIPPTLIDEEEVGMHGYDMEVLTYYQDGVLVNDKDTVVDVETYIGLENVKLFDENPGCTSMFVRNEEKGIDYEIQKDDMTWSDFAVQMGIDHDSV